ncbi:MAG TPA: NUDIX hydrolase [Actinomycetales bacterium]|jgi:8-oxo-dGTP pyrophosphatase MutT (NUDIX family)|nr:NUDIX hydrolase [Actinomycetales bacterium]
MAAGDGNGWVQCRCGRRHWGLHGAAGLLLARPSDQNVDADTHEGVDVLLQLRAGWTHQGGTWGIPGGAVDSHEDERAGALREAYEETGVPPLSVRVLDSLVSTDHVDWRYHVILGVPAGPIRPRATTAESDDVRWVPAREVTSLPLHPGFAASWPALLPRLADLARLG